MSNGLELSFQKNLTIWFKTYCLTRTLRESGMQKIMFFTIYSYRDVNEFACIDAYKSTSNRRFCIAFLKMAVHRAYFANEKIDILSFDM